MDFHILPLAPDDEPLLWEMLYQALFVPRGAPPLPRDIIRHPEIARYVQGWGRKGDCGFTATKAGNGEAIGAVWLRLWGKDDHGYGFVDEAIPELSMAVMPEYRGQGMGTKLLSEILEFADKTYNAVSLSVSSQNPAARLYRRFGFEIHAQMENSWTMIRASGVNPP